MEINDSKPLYVIVQVSKAADLFKHSIIACLCLALKADMYNLRESPALDITVKLAQFSVGRAVAVEPNITELTASLKEAGVELLTLKDALEQANVLVGCLFILLLIKNRYL